MCRSGLLLVVLLLILPTTSSALQLHWSTGGDAFTFNSATRCTLVVHADSSEGRLPEAWRLLWVADSLSIQFVAVDSLAACLLDLAQVARIEGPATRADSAANLTTAYLCSDAGDPAAIAWQALDLPAGGHGKLKAVALDLNDPDSSQVLESNEVTYNGGVDGDYPPVILHASSVHQSLRLEVTAVGSGLNSASSMAIAAVDSTWTLPLAVTARSNVSMTGVASVAAILPACQATVGSQSGAVSTGPLVADEEPPFEPESCELSFAENILPPPDPLSHHTVAIQPKDLAWVRGYVDQTNRFALHLFYIRRSLYVIPDDANEKNIGHAWTTDLNVWQPTHPDTDSITTVGRTGKFDELHVWAPTVVQRGPTFHMFYTGVRNELGRNNQRIGVATSTDLVTWNQENAPVLTSPKVLWAASNPQGYDGQQLRDPFVMPDPIHAGRWLMYFVAVDSLTNIMAVGAARSGDLRTWTVLTKPFSSTERPTSLGVPTSLESPHVFSRNGNWWMQYTVNGVKVVFETSASADPADTVAVVTSPGHPGWTNPISLFDVTEGPLPELRWWHSTEYLKMQPTVEYLAAWRDSTDGNIDIKGIYRTTVVGDSFALSCPAISGVADEEKPLEGVAMTVTTLSWGAPGAKIRLDLPAPTAVRLTVHDIAGRRRATLLDGSLPSGPSEVVWDGRDEQGLRLASGVYFVRLVHPAGARVSKIIVLR